MRSPIRWRRGRKELPVPRGLERGNWSDRDEWERSAEFALDLLAEVAGRDELADVEVLDVGCGTKLTKALIDGNRAIGGYTGVDAAAPVINWLTENVDDSRFEFIHLDVHNDLYNPEGRPLAEYEGLAESSSRFDLICAFSLFTHLNPADFEEMLKLMRRHADHRTRLVFSLYLDDEHHERELTEALESALNDPDPEIQARVREGIESAAAQPAEARDFVDVIPGRPMMQARYRPEFAAELIERSGWDVISMRPPGDYIQHHAVCKPAA